MITPEQAASILDDKFRDEGRKTISRTRMRKLIYFMHIRLLGTHGKPFISEPIEYRLDGASAPLRSETATVSIPKQRDLDTIDLVLNELGALTTAELIKLSKTPAWRSTYLVEHRLEVSNDDLRNEWLNVLNIVRSNSSNTLGGTTD